MSWLPTPLAAATPRAAEHTKTRRRGYTAVRFARGRAGATDFETTHSRVSPDQRDGLIGPQTTVGLLRGLWVRPPRGPPMERQTTRLKRREAPGVRGTVIADREANRQPWQRDGQGPNRQQPRRRTCAPPRCSCRCLLQGPTSKCPSAASLCSTRHAEGQIIDGSGSRHGTEHRRNRVPVGGRTECRGGDLRPRRALQDVLQVG